MIKRFYKDSEGWFIDLPEFLEQNLGTKANLAMVAGADTLLDRISNGTNEITLEFSDKPFKDQEITIFRTDYGMDIKVLEEYGHPIQYGAFYEEFGTGHKLWLCPVTTYVFGNYPPLIFIKPIR